MHATAEEARAETVQMLNVYADFHENDLAIPVVKGVKTPSDKFAGAEDTYAIEALMHDGKALQAATSHYFGDALPALSILPMPTRRTSSFIPSRPHGDAPLA